MILRPTVPWLNTKSPDLFTPTRDATTEIGVSRDQPFQQLYSRVISDVINRRGAIDLVRSGSLLLVVLGHFTMTVIDTSPSGSVRGSNLLALYPQWAWLGMLSPMPAFFVAAGWANAHSTINNRIRRLRILVAVSATVITIWSLISILEIVVTQQSGVLGDGARIATQPLWFLAAYVPLATVTHLLARWSAHIVAVVLTCIGVVAVGDVARFAFTTPRWVGYPGFFATWAIPWAMGIWWRLQHEKKLLPERKVGASLAVIGVIASIFLVRFAGYHPSLIDAVPGHRSNSTPPTLFTCAAAVMQVGIIMVFAQQLDVLAAQCQRILRRMNALSVGAYVWHLTAIAICAGFVALGAPMPTRFSLDWWILRLPWFIMVLVITAVLVVGTRMIQKHLQSKDLQESVHIKTNTVGLVLVSVGSLVTGLYGPRTLPTALAMTGCFLSGLLLLFVRGLTQTSSQ